MNIARISCLIPVLLATWLGTAGSVPAAEIGGFLIDPAAQQVHQVDLETGKVLGQLAVPVADIYHNAVRTREGQLLVAGHSTLSVLDGTTGKLVATVPLPEAVVPDERANRPKNDDGLPREKLPVLQRAAAAQWRLFGLDYEERTGLAYLGVQDPDSHTIIYRFEPKTRQFAVLSTFAGVGRLADLAVAGDGLRLYVAAVELLPEPAGRIYPINPLSGERGAALPVAFDPRQTQMSLSTDGNLLYLIAADRSVIVVNTRSNAAIRRLRVGGELEKNARIARVLPAADNRHLWILYDRGLLLWDPFKGKAVRKRILAAPPRDVCMPPDSLQLWTLHGGLAAQNTHLRRWDTVAAELPQIGKFDGPAGASRLLLPVNAAALPPTAALPKVAVVGFETGQARAGGRFPNVSEVVAGSLLRTRRFEIVPPLQIKTVLDTLALSPDQLRTGDPEAVRQVASLLGADYVLVGEPLRVGMPDRTLERLAGLWNPYVPFVLSQLQSPTVVARAEAFDREGRSTWKAEVSNRDDPFLSGKVDSTMLGNALVITAQDVANQFAKGALAENGKPGTDLSPIARHESLASIHRIALLGPDSALYNEKANRAESLGQVLAEKLTNLGWEVSDPDASFARLAELGIEPAQLLTSDPKLLARTLGVDAVMLGLVRSSTYVSGGFLGLSQGAAAEVVLQFELIDQQGRRLWKDIQVRTLPTGLKDNGAALMQATSAIVERLSQGLAADTGGTPRKLSP
ncbi:hypothetical protein [Gloeobacter morelensis]|uniref:Uncharacterized protein n=1 Tax=Gloeobacter morelensis MG652769 TaxID=2781736 RepID=A0ABY3PGQ1_9CYAN|nr:hypothetical protein [Gloeobacter morelensis]UFP92822.1 hypothetical protein ISF26_13405 [Gloeobacter morelensis MG652769]